jgi:hypothetical protein
MLVLKPEQVLKDFTEKMKNIRENYWNPKFPGILLKSIPSTTIGFVL